MKQKRILSNNEHERLIYFVRLAKSITARQNKSPVEIKTKNGYLFMKNLGHSASVADLEERKIKVKTESKTYNR